MTRLLTIAVVGGSGFVGSSVMAALTEQGHDVQSLRAPRLPSMPASSAHAYIRDSGTVDELAGAFAGYDSVVNAAGNPDASERDSGALTAANGVLPGVLAAACTAAQGQPRFVHVSSAVVQGRLAVLDASTQTQGFSSYADSKILGERLVREFAPEVGVVYRPPSVHARDRRVTRMTGRIARSPLATVARPGSSPSPQALAANVGSAIAYLATCGPQPPAVVAHPSEGLTTASLMATLGGRRPREIPRPLARTMVHALETAGRLAPQLAANARRVEMLWFGQQQAASWLTEAGWRPPAGPAEWQRLGADLRAQHENDRSTKGISK